jgi:hypothetical protein
LSDIGAEIIAKALEKNTGLINIDIGSNFYYIEE